MCQLQHSRLKIGKYCNVDFSLCGKTNLFFSQITVVHYFFQFQPPVYVCAIAQYQYLLSLMFSLLISSSLYYFFQVPPSMLETMLGHVEAGYTHSGNPYHNNMHACDVLQTTHYFISQTGLAVRTPLSGQSSGKK